MDTVNASQLPSRSKGDCSVYRYDIKLNLQVGSTYSRTTLLLTPMTNKLSFLLAFATSLISGAAAQSEAPAWGQVLIPNHIQAQCRCLHISSVVVRAGMEQLLAFLDTCARFQILTTLNVFLELRVQPQHLRALEVEAPHRQLQLRLEGRQRSHLVTLSFAQLYVYSSYRTSYGYWTE